MYRVEDKYMLNKPNMFILEHRISTILQPDMYSGAEGYNISSVYFDDLFDTCFNDTLDGIEDRDKYRIRIYNNSFDVIKLEVKHKKRNRISKDSCSITYEQLKALLQGEPILGDNNPTIRQFNLAISERGLRPKVIVTYERNAYVYDAGNVRITFDRNVRASRDIDRFGQPDLIYDTVDNVDDLEDIVEVKYDEFLPAFIADNLEMGQMVQVSFSKYGLCREAERCQ